jgi:transporter family-2 protein
MPTCVSRTRNIILGSAFYAHKFYTPLMPDQEGIYNKSSKMIVRLELLSGFSGVLIAVQSRINGELSIQMGDSLGAAFVSFITGLTLISLIAVFRKNVRIGLSNIFQAVLEKKFSRWRITAGMLGAIFVATSTYVVPLVGIALFTVASLAGQTAISLWVDHVGLIGSGKTVITLRRVIAALITLGAVIFSVWDRLIMSNFSTIGILLAILAGGLVGVQRALNGQINSYSNQSFSTSFLNFVSGTIFLTVLLIIRFIFTDHSIIDLTTGPWWIYIGGSIGVVYIAFTALIVQSLGVLDFTLFSVGGILLGSLVLDIVLPTSGTLITPYLVIGIFLTYLGVIINGQSPLSRR